MARQLKHLYRSVTLAAALGAAGPATASTTFFFDTDTGAITATNPLFVTPVPASMVDGVAVVARGVQANGAFRWTVQGDLNLRPTDVIEFTGSRAGSILVGDRANIAGVIRANAVGSRAGAGGQNGTGGGVGLPGQQATRIAPPSALGLAGGAGGGGGVGFVEDLPARPRDLTTGGRGQQGFGLGGGAGGFGGRSRPCPEFDLGFCGFNGEPGRFGARGADGPRGAMGATGRDGRDGVGSAPGCAAERAARAALAVAAAKAACGDAAGMAAAAVAAAAQATFCGALCPG